MKRGSGLICTRSMWKIDFADIFFLILKPITCTECVWLINIVSCDSPALTDVLSWRRVIKIFPITKYSTKYLSLAFIVIILQWSPLNWTLVYLSQSQHSSWDANMMKAVFTFSCDRLSCVLDIINSRNHHSEVRETETNASNNRLKARQQEGEISSYLLWPGGLWVAGWWWGVWSAPGSGRVLHRQNKQHTHTHKHEDVKSCNYEHINLKTITTCCVTSRWNSPSKRQMKQFKHSWGENQASDRPHSHMCNIQKV